MHGMHLNEISFVVFITKKSVHNVQKTSKNSIKDKQNKKNLTYYVLSKTKKGI